MSGTGKRKDPPPSPLPPQLLNFDGFRFGGPSGGPHHRLMVPSDVDHHGPFDAYYNSWFNHHREERGVINNRTATASSSTLSTSSSRSTTTTTATATKTTTSSTPKSSHYDVTGSPITPPSHPIKRARDYGTKRVCYDELYLPPHPYFPFFWNTWYAEIRCVRNIASPLYQVINITHPFYPPFQVYPLNAPYYTLSNHPFDPPSLPTLSTHSLHTSDQSTHSLSLVILWHQSFNLFLRYHWIRQYGEHSLPYQDYQISDKGSAQHKDKGPALHEDQGSAKNVDKIMNSGQHQNKGWNDRQKGKGLDRVHVVLEVRAIDPTKTNEHSRARHLANHKALQHSLESRLPDVRVTSQDFAVLPYRQQVALAHSAGA